MLIACDTAFYALIKFPFLPCGILLTIAVLILTLCEPRHHKTNKMSVRPAKTQISLGIRPVWSQSSLCAQWEAKDPSFLHADSEDSDQTGRMPRLIWVFAGRTVTWFVLSWRGSCVNYSDEETLSAWAITGIVLGCIVGLAILASCVKYCCKERPSVGDVGQTRSKYSPTMISELSKIRRIYFTAHEKGFLPVSSVTRQHQCAGVRVLQSRKWYSLAFQTIRTISSAFFVCFQNSTCFSTVSQRHSILTCKAIFWINN